MKQIFLSVYSSVIGCIKNFRFPVLRVQIHLQASEDAKKLVDEERAFARSEIDNAREAVQRVEEVLQEHERMSRATGKQVCAICLSCVVVDF